MNIFNSFTRAILSIKLQGIQIMTALTAIQAALLEAQANAFAEKELVAASRKNSDDKLNALHTQVTGLETQIGDLKTQLSNGTALTDGDITAIINQITDVKTAIADILPAEPAPMLMPVEPVPAPTPVPALTLV